MTEPTIGQVSEALAKLGRSKRSHPELISLLTGAFYRLELDERCQFFVHEIEKLTTEQRKLVLKALTVPS